MEAEFLSIGGELRMFLNSLAILFPCDDNDPCRSIVKVSINDTELFYPAERLDGGQRLKIPQEATETIVAALCGGERVDLSVGRFQETLVPENFLKIYNEFLK